MNYNVELKLVLKALKKILEHSDTPNRIEYCKKQIKFYEKELKKEEQNAISNL